MHKKLNGALTPLYSPFIFLVVATCLLLQGCPAIIVGAAGGAAMAAHDRRDAETMIKDEQIESNAADKIYGDKKLEKKIHVNITSYNQVVLVTGEVLTPELRDYAISLLQDIPHIKRIHNEMVVSNLTSFGSRSADSLITSKIKTKMVGAKGLDATRVKVVTENGRVFLMGLVTEKEADIAVDVARNVKDVKQVVKIFEYIPEPVVTTPTTVENKNK